MKNKVIILEARFDRSSKVWVITGSIDHNGKLTPCGYIEDLEFDFWKDADKHIDKVTNKFPEKFKKKP